MKTSLFTEFTKHKEQYKLGGLHKCNCRGKQLGRCRSKEHCTILGRCKLRGRCTTRGRYRSGGCCRTLVLEQHNKLPFSPWSRFWAGLRPERRRLQPRWRRTQTKILFLFSFFKLLKRKKFTYEFVHFAGWVKSLMSELQLITTVTIDGLFIPKAVPLKWFCTRF